MRSVGYEIVREVVNECNFTDPARLAVESKSDSTLVTDLDPRVEEIVIRHVAERFGNGFLVVAEETSREKLPSIDEAVGAQMILTVDGIDGTGDFVRHVVRGEENQKWLVGMTCLMQQFGESGCFRPVLAFAYRPPTEELFLFENDKSLIVKRAFKADEHWDELQVRTGNQPRGTLDVAIKKPDANYVVVDESIVSQYGPSGYNMAELATSARDRTKDAPNFTMFQYKAWDFGLWPVLSCAGYEFASYTNGIPYRGFSPRDFDAGNGSFSLIRDPIVICIPGDFQEIRKSIKQRT